jgi:hypothetical protein
LIRAEDLAICGYRTQLQARVSAILCRLASLALRQADMINCPQDSNIDAVDQEIEATLRNKERSIGALKQHRLEHGC